MCELPPSAPISGSGSTKAPQVGGTALSREYGIVLKRLGVCGEQAAGAPVQLARQIRSVFSYAQKPDVLWAPGRHRKAEACVCDQPPDAGEAFSDPLNILKGKRRARGGPGPTYQPVDQALGTGRA